MQDLTYTTINKITKLVHVKASLFHTIENFTQDIVFNNHELNSLCL